MKLNQEQLTSEIARHTGYRREVVYVVLESLYQQVILHLKDEDSVALGSFGTFSMKRRAARTGRNPRKNVAVPIPPKAIPAFKSGSRLKAIEKEV